MSKKYGAQTHGTSPLLLRGGGIAKRGTGVALKTGGRAALRFGSGRTDLLEELGRVEGERSNPNRRAEISRVHGELNRGYRIGGTAGKYQETYRPPQQKKSERQDFSRKRKEFKKGDRPWGTGPKPGTHEFLLQNLHKRKGKAIGGPAAKGIGALVKKFKKKKVYPETEDLTHQVGPYAGDVGSEGKRRKLGPRGRGKSPRRPQAPGPKGRRPWRGAIPGRPRPGTPAPKFGPGKPRDPREPKKFGPGKPRDPREPKKYQPAAEGGRIGFKKGGSDKNWIQKATASIKKRGTKGKCTPITKPGCTGRAKALAKTFKKMAKKRKS